MGWVYQDDDAKTKEDYIGLLNEINAYRWLDGQDFDFGTGLIVNEMSFGSEDAYYEMDIWCLEGWIDWFEEKEDAAEYHYIMGSATWYYLHSRNKRENKYVRNRKYRKRLWHMVDKQWGTVWLNSSWNRKVQFPKKHYRRKRSSYLKKQSSRKIRRYKGSFQVKGNKHKRLFDFWWELN